MNLLSARMQLDTLISATSVRSRAIAINCTEVLRELEEKQTSSLLGTMFYQYQQTETKQVCLRDKQWLHSSDSNLSSLVN